MRAASPTDFLADPQPRSRWCGNRGQERWSPLWRPFDGPLSASARRHAVTVLKNLYRVRADQNGLMDNPRSAVGVPRTAGPKLNAGRSFSVAHCAFIEAQQALLPCSAARQRLSFRLHLRHATRRRLSEMEAARVDGLQWMHCPADASDDQPMGHGRSRALPAPPLHIWHAGVEVGKLGSGPVSPHAPSARGRSCARCRSRPSLEVGRRHGRSGDQLLTHAVSCIRTEMRPID